MDDTRQPRGAHLVGSVPLADTEAVLRAAGAQLGAHLRRIPDGETGERGGFIGWQVPAFMQLAGIAQTGDSRVAPPELGYADAAIASYPIFAALRAQGIIPRNARFQVSLPTPIALVHALVDEGDHEAVEALHATGMRAELDRILAAIPHADLAIQWDTPIEFAVLEGVMPSYYADPRAAIFERLPRWGGWVPAGVELGYHLCYGDNDGQHFIEPADAGLLVEVANHLAESLARPLNWVHMPVPQDRSDAAYYAPLAGLRPETELYLGLVHLADGVDGARQRIAAAVAVVPAFGVATECGMGRRAPETALALLDLHAAIAHRSKPWTQTGRVRNEPNERSRLHHRRQFGDRGRASCGAPRARRDGDHRRARCRSASAGGGCTPWHGDLCA